MVKDVPQAEVTEAADDLMQLLGSGMFDQFLELFRKTAQSMDNGAVVLVDTLNERMSGKTQCSEPMFIVSQKMEGKHLVVIQGASSFFGGSHTVTRNMFLV
ncbi:MAG TPA: hypothetical protein V6C86_22645 [Oculatellaceae cyanobacterium]